MSIRWTRIVAITALAAALVATPALAQDFDDWDENHDAGIDRSEWNLGMEERSRFESRDRNADGDLSRSEFDAGVRSLYDANDDGILSREEFETYRDETLGRDER